MIRTRARGGGGSSMTAAAPVSVCLGESFIAVACSRYVSGLGNQETTRWRREGNPFPKKLGTRGPRVNPLAANRLLTCTFRNDNSKEAPHARPAAKPAHVNSRQRQSARVPEEIVNRSSRDSTPSPALSAPPALFAPPPCQRRPAVRRLARGSRRSTRGCPAGRVPGARRRRARRRSPRAAGWRPPGRPPQGTGRRWSAGVARPWPWAASCRSRRARRHRGCAARRRAACRRRRGRSGRCRRRSRPAGRRAAARPPPGPSARSTRRT